MEYLYLDPPRGAKWVVKGAIKQPLRVQTPPLGGCWYEFTHFQRRFSQWVCNLPKVSLSFQERFVVSTTIFCSGPMLNFGGVYILQYIKKISLVETMLKPSFQLFKIIFLHSIISSQKLKIRPPPPHFLPKENNKQITQNVLKPGSNSTKESFLETKKTRRNIGNSIWLVVSTHLKNISQIGSFPQVGVKIKNIWNHHLAIHSAMGFCHIGTSGVPSISCKAYHRGRCFFPASEGKAFTFFKGLSSWWFQPLWKIWVKLDHFPR